MKVSLLNYGVGNLHSIRKALELAGGDVRVVTDVPSDPGCLVLPGVGAFGTAAAKLASRREALVAHLERGGPLLGVCLGMQLLFDSSEESPGRGLGFIRGRVERLPHEKLPQIGWNDLSTRDDPLFRGLPDRPHVYFVNSFAPVPKEPGVVIARADYGRPFVAAVRKGHAWGVQFHPEKSSTEGLRMLKNFLDAASEVAS
ncbi:MAG: imidazole glycerol phosphate synthase subunit HisH [Methanobacteriota archaeon]